MSPDISCVIKAIQNNRSSIQNAFFTAFCTVVGQEPQMHVIQALLDPFLSSKTCM